MFQLLSGGESQFLDSRHATESITRDARTRLILTPPVWNNAADAALHCWLQFRSRAICTVASAELRAENISEIQNFCVSLGIVDFMRFQNLALNFAKKNAPIRVSCFLFLRRRPFMTGNL